MELIDEIATPVHPGPVITMLIGIVDSYGDQQGCGKREPLTPTSTGPHHVSYWQRIGEYAQFECSRCSPTR